MGTNAGGGINQVRDGDCLLGTTAVDAGRGHLCIAPATILPRWLEYTSGKDGDVLNVKARTIDE